jgi:hypothetical protein
MAKCCAISAIPTRETHLMPLGVRPLCYAVAYRNLGSALSSSKGLSWVTDPANNPTLNALHNRAVADRVTPSA